MPLLDYKGSMSARKLLRMGQLSNFKADRFSKFDNRLDAEHGFASAVADVDVNGPMFVTIKEETITVFLEDLWHSGIIARIFGIASDLDLTRIQTKVATKLRTICRP